MQMQCGLVLMVDLRLLARPSTPYLFTEWQQLEEPDKTGAYVQEWTL